MSDVINSDVLDDIDDHDRAYAEVAQRPYRFRRFGKVWTLPHMTELDYRTRAKVESFELGGSVDGIAEFNKLIFGEEQAAAWQEHDQTDKYILMMLRRWMKYSGVEQGESEASSDSSDSTGESSRPTSEASTDSGSPQLSSATTVEAPALSPPVSSSVSSEGSEPTPA